MDASDCDSSPSRSFAEVTTMPDPCDSARAPWQLVLFRRSLKKRATLKAILDNLPDVEGKRCLEIGCATGVTSYFLRQRGGQWISLDFETDHVAATKDLVGDGVVQGNESHIPFPNDSFDCVVGINFLEHIEDDMRYLGEMARVLRPGGTLLFTGPRGERRRIAFRIKRLLGLTSDTGGFGHARDGYPPATLRKMFSEVSLNIEHLGSYSRFLTEVVEDFLNFAYHKLSTRKPAGTPEKQGDFHGETAPMSGQAFKKVGWAFRIYSLVYPILRVVTSLDALLFFAHGHMFVCTAGKAEEARTG